MKGGSHCALVTATTHVYMVLSSGLRGLTSLVPIGWLCSSVRKSLMTAEKRYDIIDIPLDHVP